MTRIKETESQILVYKVKVINEEDLIVCDVMKSLTIYSYSKGEFK